METKLKFKVKFLLIPVLTMMLLFTTEGCKTDNTIGPSSENLDFSSTSSNDMAGPVAIEIHTVKVLIKDIKLNVAASNENMVNYKTGMYVLYLDLTSSVNVVSTGYIQAGTYDKVRFEIHKPSDNETPPDPEFIDASGRYSIIVKGKFNSGNFTFKSSVSAHQKLTFPGSLVVTAEGRSNITLQAKPYLWFIVGGVVVDPMNEFNRNAIELNITSNINNNIRVFVDNDRNGQPD